MGRRYEDPVHVRPGDEEGSGAEAPGSFLWRGRLYVVRSVLGHWRERRAWWAEAAARAVHGDDVGPGDVGPGDVGPGEAPSSSEEVPAPGTRLALSDEREVWRVEAGCGRAAGLGIYDLCHDPGRSWSLVRVSD